MIRLINYPYKDWKVGDIIDLGEKKNESMISIGRAVAAIKVEKKIKKENKKTTFTEKVEKKKKVNKKKINGDSNNNRPNKQED